jgi:hypothetical protein
VRHCRRSRLDCRTTRPAMLRRLDAMAIVGCCQHPR